MSKQCTLQTEESLDCSPQAPRGTIKYGAPLACWLIMSNTSIMSWKGKEALLVHLSNVCDSSLK